MNASSAVLKLPKNAHHQTEGDVVIERRAEDEPQRRERHERIGHLLFVRVQARRDEHPHLIHDERRRDEDAGDERHRDVERKRLARLRVNQLDAGRQNLARRREDEIEDGLDEGEGGDDADDDGDAGADDAFSELVEMLQKRHLPFGQGSVFDIVILRLFGSGTVSP